MTRFVGNKVTTHRQEYWDRGRNGYYRQEVVVDEWLHATKGWRSPKVTKRVFPVRRRQIYGVQTSAEFNRW